MDRANKAMRQRIGRMKTNLGFAEKRDELAFVSTIDQRNQKVVAAINTYKKNVSGCIKTGLREDAAEKRKKKCDEYALAADLITDSKELEMTGSTCLAKVLQRIQTALNGLMDERVRSEMNIEKRVLDGMTRYLEMDKALTKSKERLNHTIVDVDIARKALTAKQHEEARQSELQEELDTHCSKLESLKDSTITDLFTLAAKEQEISLVFAAYIDELLEYHRFAVRTLENALPEMRRDIANARPRPMFGVDLEEHLRHINGNISLVIEKCCTNLRVYGMRERGVFRVNGNNTKIRRMKAAFDAGQIEVERDAFATDPHSVCSVLKSYLRELPDPLLTNRLQQDWVAATKLEGEDRLVQVEACLAQLPPAYHNNLAYLVNFLCELLQYEQITMMNAGNLAIVFGPNLVGHGNETDNVTGSKIVETLLLNEERFFGRSPYYLPHNGPQNVGPPSSKEQMQHAITRVNSTPYAGGRHSTRTVAMQRENNLAQHNNALSIDTHGSFRSSTKSLSHSPMEPLSSHQPQTFSNSTFTHSPQGVRRPRVTAPLPPSHTNASSESIADNMSRSAYIPSSRGNAPTATLTDVMDHLNSLRGEGSEGNSRYNEQDRSRDSSFDSIDDLDEDSMSRSLDRPLRPPPPSLRPSNHMSQKARPVSYNIAVGVSAPADAVLIDVTEPEPEARGRSSTSPGDGLSSHPVTTSTTQTPSGYVHRSIVSIEGPVAPARNRPPLPNKPGKLSESDSGTNIGPALKPKESTKL